MQYDNVVAPKATVLVGGVAAAGIISVEAATTNCFATDRFRISAATSVMGLDFWTQNGVEIELQFLLNDKITCSVVGMVDRSDIDASTQTICIDGRNLAARFLAANSIESFENQTSSEIVALLCERRGLQKNVTSTAQRIGRDFESQYSRVALCQHSRSITEWDVLTRLAEVEGFDLSLRGRELIFAPPDRTMSPIMLPPALCIAFRAELLNHLGGATEVIVKSWDCRGVRAVMQIARRGGADEPTTRHVIIRPNLSDSAALQLAERTLLDVVQHGRSFFAEVPGDLGVVPGSILTVSGVGMAVDGNYRAMEVDRRLSARHGFTQSIRAKALPWTDS